MAQGSRKITKAEWDRLGGLRNSRCWRRQTATGRWLYYVEAD